MATLTIQASKNGEIVETPRSNSVLAVAQARMLLEAGWRVHIADATGRQFGPSEFDELLPLRYRATNFEPYPFEWVDQERTAREYAAVLTRVSRQYDKSFA